MYGMETYIKIFLQFPHKFWPDAEFFSYAAAMRGHYPIWQNMNFERHWGEEPPYVLMVTVLNDNARKVERQPEKVTIAESLDVLRSMFPNQSVPEPSDIRFHSWSSDPFAKGSYSYWPVGVSEEGKKLLCAPVGARLWFAGEACHQRYSTMVHGAMMSGNNTAIEVLDLLRNSGTRRLATESLVQSTNPIQTTLIL